MRKKWFVSIILLSLWLLTGCGAESESETAESAVSATETVSETIPETSESETESETIPETSESETESETLPEIPEAELPEIFLIDKMSYGGLSAPGYPQSSITFIDVSGAVYYINNAESYDTAKMFETFSIVRKYTEPIMQFDAETVQKLCTFGEAVNPESEFDGDGALLADAVNIHISFRNPETGDLTECYTKESGITHNRLDDNAQEFVNLYQETSQALSTAPVIPRMLYTQDKALFLSIAAESEVSGKYFLKDEKEVKQFAEQCHVPFDEILTSQPNTPETYVYFAELNAPSAEGMLHYAGDLPQDFTWEFLHSSETASGYCNIIGFPASAVRVSTEETPAAPDGSEWAYISD